MTRQAVTFTESWLTVVTLMPGLSAMGSTVRYCRLNGTSWVGAGPTSNDSSTSSPSVWPNTSVRFAGSLTL